MTDIKLCGFMSTNIEPQSIAPNFLNLFSAFLANKFGTKDKFITLELQQTPMMIRDGSMNPMLNLRLFHNCDRVESESKHDFAKQIAGWLARSIRVPEDRVLVLFVDTRFTCGDSSQQYL